MGRAKRQKGQALAEYAAVALALSLLLAASMKVVRLAFPPVMTGTAASLSSDPLPKK